jgi:hypothetical protein
MCASRATRSQTRASTLLDRGARARSSAAQNTRASAENARVLREFQIMEQGVIPQRWVMPDVRSPQLRRVN